MNVCKLCKYNARDKFNYERHIQSKQHISKEKASNKCQFCDNYYSNKSNRNKHEKKCKNRPVEIQIQGSGNNNIINSSLSNINNSLNSTNINVNIPENSISAKDLESYMMEIKDLVKHQFTDCFQKLVLTQMMTEKTDIMDYLDEIDEEILKEWKVFREQHEKLCQITEFVDILDENGEKIMTEYGFAKTSVKVIGMSTQCFHHRANFKLGINELNKILTKVLLNNTENLVVTHQTISLSGTIQLLFKHLKSLHDSGCVKKLLEKSKHADKFNIEESDITLDKDKYSSMYSTLENLAKKKFRQNKAR